MFNSLQTINPNIPDNTPEQVAKPEIHILIKNNKALHQWLLEGVKVEFNDQNGASLNVLQELGGWESIEMARRHAHLAPENLAVAAAQNFPSEGK